jgi:hypothetical protein
MPGSGARWASVRGLERIMAAIGEKHTGYSWLLPASNARALKKCAILILGYESNAIK